MRKEKKRRLKVIAGGEMYTSKKRKRLEDDGSVISQEE